MRTVTIRVRRKDAVDRAVRFLKRSLKKGDIILTGPVPRNILTRYFHITLKLTTRLLKGVTHSCLYLGNGKILDIDYKILRSGAHIEEVTLREFVQGKLSYFGGVRIYVVKPKHYSRYQRRLAVAESRKSFIAKNKELTHTLWGSIVVGFRYIFYRRFKYKEDLSFRKDWTCGHMVAYLMKKSNVDIGRRASYTFLPVNFLYSNYFKVERKIEIK